MVVTVGPGIAPESDIGVFGILGYDPSEEHPGRGVLEALGIGMDFDDGDLAYRINFATADVAGDRGPAGRSRPDLVREPHALADEVNAHARACPTPPSNSEATIEHRGALVIRTGGGPLSANVTNTDPAYRREGHLGVALETFDPVVVDGDAARRLDSRAAGRRSHQRVRRGRRADPRRIRRERRRRGRRASCPAT